MSAPQPHLLPQIFFSAGEVSKAILRIGEIGPEHQRKEALSEARALRILFGLGLVTIPETCRNGHPWEMKFDAAPENGGAYIPYQSCSKGNCNGRKNYFRNGYMANSTLPASVEVEIIRFFISKISARATAEILGITTKTVKSRYQFIRKALLSWLQKRLVNESLLGYDIGETYVAVDETFVTRRKYHAGRGTANTQKIIIGAAEVSANGGLTGRFAFELIPNRSQKTMMGFIERNVSKGAVLYTDSHRSYMALKTLGYPLHQTVNHSKRQFKDKRTGATTNAIEGVWSGIKRILRQQDLRKISTTSLMHISAEYAWRVEESKRNTQWVKEEGLVRLARILSLYLKSLES
jgi:hypothetical protein